MTCGQTKAARRRMLNDKRYAYRTTAETSQRRLAASVAKERAMTARKSKKK